MNEIIAEAPRARRYQKVVQRILDAATETIVDDGLDGLSMNKLAAALDYTPGALYRYFASKDALVKAIVERLLGDLAVELAAASQHVPNTPLSRLVACVEAYAELAARHPNRFALISMLLAAPKIVLTSDEDASPLIAAMMVAMQPATRALVDAEHVGALAPRHARSHPHDRALVLFAGVQGVLMLRKQAARLPDLIDIPRLLHASLTTLLVGWGATPSAIAEAFSRPSSHAVVSQET